MLSAAALTALALAAGPLDPELSVAAGAGYESNLNHDPSLSQAVGGGYSAGRAGGGGSLELGDSTSLYGGLRFDGQLYPAYSDLSTSSAGVEAILFQELSESLALVLAPLAARSWSGDPARDATLLAATLTLRVRPVGGLTLRGSYGHTRRDASDPAFSYDRDRLGASVEWRLGEGSYLGLGYAVEFGQDVFYRAVSGGMGMGGGHQMSTFGPPELAYPANATSHTIGPTLEVPLGGDLFLEGGYAWRKVFSTAGDYQSHLAHLDVGWRL